MELLITKIKPKVLNYSGFDLCGFSQIQAEQQVDAFSVVSDMC
jgi:hypothetical protein